MQGSSEDEDEELDTGLAAPEAEAEAPPPPEEEAEESGRSPAVLARRGAGEKHDNFTTIKITTKKLNFLHSPMNTCMQCL